MGIMDFFNYHAEYLTKKNNFNALFLSYSKNYGTYSDSKEVGIFWCTLYIIAYLQCCDVMLCGC